MSTSAILPVSSIDFASSSATASQQTVFNNLLGQLQQSIGNGDLTGAQTYLNALNALSPSSAGSQTALGTFLTSLTSALDAGSVSAAQSALSTYQSNAPTTSSPSSPQPAVQADTTPTADTIAEGLILSQIQLSLITTLLSTPAGTSGSDASSNSVASLTSLLNAAYPASASAGSTPSSASPTSASAASTPYDTLVSAIQSSLAAGNGTLTPAIAYLQTAGNFVNTSA